MRGAARTTRPTSLADESCKPRSHHRWRLAQPPSPFRRCRRAAPHAGPRPRNAFQLARPGSRWMAMSRSLRRHRRAFSRGRVAGRCARGRRRSESPGDRRDRCRKGDARRGSARVARRRRARIPRKRKPAVRRGLSRSTVSRRPMGMAAARERCAACALGVRVCRSGTPD